MEGGLRGTKDTVLSGIGYNRAIKHMKMFNLTGITEKKYKNFKYFSHQI